MCAAVDGARLPWTVEAWPSIGGNSLLKSWRSSANSAIGRPRSGEPTGRMTPSTISRSAGSISISSAA